MQVAAAAAIAFKGGDGKPKQRPRVGPKAGKAHSLKSAKASAAAKRQHEEASAAATPGTGAENAAAKAPEPKETKAVPAAKPSVAEPAPNTVSVPGYKTWVDPIKKSPVFAQLEELLEVTCNN